ncbi:MAG: pantoate--beta-alanine ligase [Moraxella sp.]|nr:pantoate--beta-alanine ligase [Moraxella sp.]
MTQIFYTIKDLQNALTSHKAGGQRIGFVPTMGNLHAGHLSLVEIASRHADVVVVSIFVNPTQFGVGEDFDNYPRTLEDDMQKLQQSQCTYVFAPSIEEMYPVYPPNVQVLSGDITKILCGKTRPTHFDGVGLVVGKLFNIVRPDVAVFGKKDYQQLAIIRQLNRELNFGIEIIGGDIVRDTDGLALSSRNGYLTKEERAQAPVIHQTLQALAKQLQVAAFDEFTTLVTQAAQSLNAQGLRVDYLELLTDTLAVPTPKDKQLTLLAAIYVGQARLLDNIEINL